MAGINQAQNWGAARDVGGDSYLQHNPALKNRVGSRESQTSHLFLGLCVGVGELSQFCILPKQSVRGDGTVLIAAGLGFLSMRLRERQANEEHLRASGKKHSQLTC